MMDVREALSFVKTKQTLSVFKTLRVSFEFNA
jgi:hypothetical protein